MAKEKNWVRHFPYLVQYFSCKLWEQSNKDIEAMLQYFMYLDATAVGPIQGETGIEGLKIDFNNGIRLQVPSGKWHVIIGDFDTGLVFYDKDVSEAVIVSMEKYYIHWQVEVFRNGQRVFGHIFDPEGQKLRLFFNSNAIGDTLALLPYVSVAQDWFRVAEVYVTIGERMRDICGRLFPNVRLQEHAEENTYATYFFNASVDFSGGAPVDGRLLSLTHLGQVVLGMPVPANRVVWVSGERTILEPYVCIGVQASSAGKGWLYPGGWDEVTEYLKSLGYRVLCIDRDKKLKESGFTLEMPQEAEDFTGDRPLLERADMLHHAEFFVGLSSGLSWLAYTAGCPVVMIGGFTMYWNEFPTPYRVYNRLVCNGCYNDPRVIWKNSGCPRSENRLEEEFLCSKKITPRMVIHAIDRLIADKKAGRIKHA